MKKFLRKFAFAFMIVIMAYFVMKNYNTKDSTKVSASTSNSSKALVTLINGNKKAGDLVFQIEENGSYGSETYTEAYVPIGKKIKVSFKNELNDGYSVAVWANTNGVTYTPIKGSDGELYKNKSLSFTVKTDYKVFCAAKGENEHLVTFYETSSTSLSSVIGYSVVEDGAKASLDYVHIPSRTGFDFDKFSESLDNVSEDMIVYPMYESNVITIFRDYWRLFVKGLGITLLLAIISIFLSLFVGLALCLGKISSIKPLKAIASTYVEVIRGVPSLLLLLIVYCIVGPTKIHIGSFFTTEVISCILALFINSSAYTAEIFRSGVQAVDVGQMEAGRALGLSNWQVLRKVILPQGLKNALPSLGNELVMIIKETSLAYSVNSAIGELMSAKQMITSATGNSLSPYIIIAIIYFIVTFSLSQLIRVLEKRLNQ